MTSLRKTQHAFTLVELLAVITIIGILTAVALPAAGAILTVSRTASLEAELDRVRTRVTQTMTLARLEATLGSIDESVLRTEIESDRPIAPNPFNGQTGVGSASNLSAAQARAVSGTEGWKLFVSSDATTPTVIFYANSLDPTDRPGSAPGSKRSANAL